MVTGRGRQNYQAFLDEWFAEPAVGLRQMPVTLALLVSIWILWITIEPKHPALLVVAALLVVGVQAVGSLGDWTGRPRAWRMTLPVIQILAIGLMDLGSDLALVNLDVLLFLPVISLALEPGPWGLTTAVVAASCVLFSPVVLDTARPLPLLHAVVTIPIMAAVAGRAHGIVEIARHQATELSVARDEVAARAGELRASRDTLRSVMLAATEQAIIGTDAHGVILAVSTGAERMFGRTQDELVGNEVAGLLRPESGGSGGSGDEDGSTLGSVVGRARTGGTHLEELDWTRPDGSARNLEYVVTPRPAPTGSSPDLPAGYLFVVTDVTDRHEEERRQDEFISLVSHEFRTPLASILGYLDLLRLESGPMDEQQLDYLDVLQRNAQRLRSLVDALLTSAQLVFGAPMTAAEADVTEIVRASVQTQIPTARAMGVSLEVSGDPSVVLLTDPQRLGQLVDNLLSNAVKYSHSGGTVEVSALRDQTTEGGRAARIQVTDEGSGIARDELSRITERFYRSRDTRRRRVQGIGLGLSLVQAIAEEHGGTLTIDSEPGRGTHVEVVLPDLPRPPEESPDP